MGKYNAKPPVAKKAPKKSAKTTAGRKSIDNRTSPANDADLPTEAHVEVTLTQVA